jgi:hypothetical protein
VASLWRALKPGSQLTSSVHQRHSAPVRANPGLASLGIFLSPAFFVSTGDGTKRQREMNMTTKTLWMVVAIAALMSVSATADDTIAIKANVPFDFMVGNQSVPAGEYVFAQNGSWNMIQISSWDMRTALRVLRYPAGNNTTNLPYALVFHKYGNRHFLKQVWAGDGVMGVQFPTSRAEKEEMALSAPAKTTLIASAAR